MPSENSFRHGLRDGIPIALGYLGVSFSFGILCSERGMPIWAAVLMSLTNLTSAGQFAGLGLIAQSAGVFEMAVTQLVINMRYALMSVTLSQKVDESVTPLHRLIASYFVTDEIFAVAASKGREVGRNYLYGLGVAPIIGWSLGTLAGAAAGSVLPQSISSALGIALFGMFIAIIVPPAKKVKSVRVVIAISAVLSCILRFTPGLDKISSGFVIIICAVVASLAGALFFPANPGEEASR